MVQTTNQNEHVNVNDTVNGTVTVKEINNNINTRKLKFAQSLIPLFLFME
jgi:hypothetical protein